MAGASEPGAYAGAGTAAAGPGDLRDRPLGEIARDLMSDISLLVRQEMELAKAEMAQKGRRAVPAIGMLGAAGIVALHATGALVAFLIIALDKAMPLWLAALVVTLAYAALAGVLAVMGKQRASRIGKPVPEQTIETVKEDVRWAKTRATSARR